MGLNNFTGNLDDSDDSDDSGPGGPGGNSGPGGPGITATPAPPPAGTAGRYDEVKSLLIDYNQRFQVADPTLFRDALIEQTASVLISMTKPNPLLVGPAGVGKTKIVEDIARRIANKDSSIPAQLLGHTIYELPINNLIAGSGIVGEIEEKVQGVIDFATDPKNKVILFIDEIHRITGGTSSHGEGPARKISQILKPALARGDMSVIGATTTNESRGLDEDPAFARRFTRLIVDELTVDQTVVVLQDLRSSLMKHYRYQITISDEVAAEAVQIAEENSKVGQHRPDNAITLLDRAIADRVIHQQRLIADASAAGDKVLLQALQAGPVPITANRIIDVARRLMTGHAQQPALDVHRLSATLHARLEGQDEVLGQLVDKLARADLNLFPTNRPMTWMLAGASGVGKTETAKIIAEEMTGSEPIILNMTEYAHPSALSRIVGAPPGYIGSDSDAELPFDTLESNPYRVILLDEFEKADKAVQRLFLSAFDEGYIRSARGKQIDFSKSLIICTTNAARESISGSQLGFGTGPKKVSHQSLNRALADHFDTELLGRFETIVGYQAIDEPTFRRILANEYDRQREHIADTKSNLAKRLPAQIDDHTLRALSESVFVVEQGARPAGRTIRAWIENHLMSTAAQATQAAQAAQAAQATQPVQPHTTGDPSAAGGCHTDSTE